MGKEDRKEGKNLRGVTLIDARLYRFNLHKARQVQNVRDRLRQQYLIRRRSLEMQEDYEALKVLTSMVGDPHLKFALMGDFVYQRLLRQTEIKNDSISFHKIVHDDDLQTHFGLGPIVFLDFLQRNGAKDAEGKRTLLPEYPRWEPPKSDDLPRVGQWYQNPHSSFWEQYTEEDIDRMVEERRQRLRHDFVEIIAPAVPSK
ncbi:hypothetical protein LPW11_04395 [Geomonas sp. RF6]|uniref:hypothetical protein n=1 Tax=Geomonas sp. RF6 TaxID=2897342 RepID=UPI001E341C9C|nr:hypothetical protein [Geomonas sp. RF6]UFS71439.1 hypothetical protein LPW11_04395 [Geomonas sp. RF6]